MNKGLIIKQEWIDKILFCGKKLEMRSRKTNMRGRIFLIEAGSGLITGECQIVDCFKLLESDFEETKHLHQVEDVGLLKKWCWAWQISGVMGYRHPIPYKHPQGAVVWVNLPVNIRDKDSE